MVEAARGPRLLASVMNAREGALAARHGADIVDCKDASAGALGALPVAMVADVRAALPVHVPVSATIGDLVPEPAAVSAAAAAMAESGVDFVKVGFFPGGDAIATIAALGQLRMERAALVGVLLADREPDLGLIEAMGGAGFAGVMLDTAGKNSGSLMEAMGAAAIYEFLARARRAGCFAGLAGSLKLAHIPRLKQLAPDVLGFRGALCRGGARSAPLDAGAVSAVRRAIDARNRGPVERRVKEYST